MQNNSSLTAVVLAAGFGSRISGLTSNPKCLLKINNQSLLERHLTFLKACHIHDVIIVTGHKEELLLKEIKKHQSDLNIQTVFNEHFKITGNSLSLYLGLSQVKDKVLIMDADLCYDLDILRSFAEKAQDNTFLCGDVDINDIECSKVLVDQEKCVRLIADKRPVSPEELEILNFAGEALGMIKLDHSMVHALKDLMEKTFKDPAELKTNWERIFNFFILQYPMKIAKTVNTNWIEIDTQEDYTRALRMFDR